jgi:hypothetical protein
MEKRWLMRYAETSILVSSIVVFGFGCVEVNAVIAMSFQSVGIIGFLTVLHLKSK